MPLWTGEIISFAVNSVVMNPNEIDPPDINGSPQPTTWLEQRSRLNGIAVEFSAPLVLDVNSIQLTNLGVNSPREPDEIQLLDASLFSTDRNTLTIDLSTVELPAGVYQLAILPTLLDQSGRSLDGNADGVGGDAFVFVGNIQNGFYKLAADWNGDFGVSVFDFTTFSYWFGTAIPDAPLYADTNQDAGVSVFDFTVFSTNFGKGVVSPAALAEDGIGTRIASQDVHGDGQARNRIEQKANRLQRLATHDAVLLDWADSLQQCESLEIECIDFNVEDWNQFWHELDLSGRLDWA
ncbi:MAG: hypothetical protein ACI9HK_001312 [Pirellulaceae bacterium]